MKSKYHLHFATVLQQPERGIEAPLRPWLPSVSALTEQLSPEAPPVTSGAQILITLCLAQYRPVTFKKIKKILHNRNPEQRKPRDPLSSQDDLP